MERTSVESMVNQLAEQFQLQLGGIQWRQKRGYLSAQKQGQTVRFILKKEFATFDPPFIEAALYVTYCRLTKQTHLPKYQYFFEYMKNHPPLSNSSQISLS